MTGREKFKKYRVFVAVLIKVNSFFPRSVNRFLFSFFRNTIGRIGLLIRYVLVKNLSESCGENVSIHPGVYLFHLNKVCFGDNISIHPMCYIEGAGGLMVSSNVSIAHSVSILTTNHSWSDLNTPIKYNSETFEKIVIDDDVWIGCGSRILSGVTINKRSIVAAGAVVNKDVMTNSIYGGIPARLIKKLDA
jgi:acetyltransferase-like isoleucine patch superfamily enzyme